MRIPSSVGRSFVVVAACAFLSAPVVAQETSPSPVTPSRSAAPPSPTAAPVSAK